MTDCLDILFFFSSRRRHTRWPRDWSSDVCSSDLAAHRRVQARVAVARLQTVAALSFVNFVRLPSYAVRRTGAVTKIGRASCRERVWSSVGAGSLQKKREEGQGDVVEPGVGRRGRA